MVLGFRSPKQTQKSNDEQNFSFRDLIKFRKKMLIFKRLHLFFIKIDQKMIIFTRLCTS